MPIEKKRRNRYNPASEDFHKEDFPFYWLVRVYGRYTVSMEKILKRINLDIPRWRLINILFENGSSSISEISEHAVAKLSTVTKIVYRMKDDGLVETSQSAQDGRVTQVSLTEKGRQAFFDMHTATEELFNRSFEGLTEAQLRKLNLILSSIFSNLPNH
ncbi:winged helix-turn-helix transcriptional regulator [Pseudomonas fluorescens]|uniref:MarR family winged helix-turn-helix transcriptional regulator n=1 Tax=Pseudomonas TaxID=286 RepID=UPI00177F4393|nr:MarR family winged helix-turn-helix transcriptional regulator [Pseudomonas paracarnis]MBD8254062.1 winged helix-turn-helix transcriptional regulator [Pseudomonas fluorescens]MBH3398137.1 winged helix-turn-helix transcriptional regulator [Pseudomonas fluorescens]MDV3056607.1 MarR family winged helix-turn-helix transcriptional regulator [Pseudomonas paracarnis]